MNKVGEDFLEKGLFVLRNRYVLWKNIVCPVQISYGLTDFGLIILERKLIFCFTSEILNTVLTFVNCIFCFVISFAIINFLSDQQRYDYIHKKLDSFIKVLVSFINWFNNKCSILGFFVHESFISLMWTYVKLDKTDQFLVFHQRTNIKSMFCPL